MHRREVLRLATAAGACFGATAIPRWASAQNLTLDDDSDEFLSEFEAFADQPVQTVGPVTFVADDKSEITDIAVSVSTKVPQLSPELVAGIAALDYWSIAGNARPQTAWPNSTRAADYSHLAAFPPGNATFSLTAKLLRELALRNSFELETERPVIVFGLRGCAIVDGSASRTWGLSHDLIAIEPSHVTSNCVVGVWRTGDDHLAVFRASTVPAVKEIYRGLATGGYGTSILPTGLYRYSAGTHLVKKERSIQRGALQISGEYLVLRTAKELAYDPFEDTSFWTRGAAHNIHAGGRVDRFSCAGCQVVPGGYEDGRLKAKGEWLKFQMAAGLVNDEGFANAADTYPSFLYMLLTGRECAIASENSSAFKNGYLRLRPGSSGADVIELQKNLISRYSAKVKGLTAQGTFDMLTGFGVLIDHQSRFGEYTTPVVVV
jgi:hypothetical protein